MTEFVDTDQIIVSSFSINGNFGTAVLTAAD
jgi:hypothetical protein